MVTMEKIFTNNNMHIAAKKVAKKKSAGVDGISAKLAKEILNQEYPAIYKSLIKETYNPKAVILREIPKPNGKTRPIAIATALDRTIQGCIHKEIYPIFSSEMSVNSYGFRLGRNCMQVVNQMRKYIEDGYTWVGVVDLSGCFNHINQNKVLYKTREKIKDERVVSLINKYLKVTYTTKDKDSKNYKGCPQGSPLSPLQANIVLDEIDKEMESRDNKAVRYADDIFIFCKSEKAIMRTVNNTCKFIENKCKLEVNKEKLNITHVDNGFTALGFYLYMSRGIIHVTSSNKRYTELREKIKTICSKPSDKTIEKINGCTRGWISYYKDVEIGTKCRKLDLLIKKNLDKAEKRNNSIINREKLVNCYEFYKKKRHSSQEQGRIHLPSGKDGQPTPEPTTDSNDMAVSNTCRDPP